MDFKKYKIHRFTYIRGGSKNIVMLSLEYPPQVKPLYFVLKFFFTPAPQVNTLYFVLKYSACALNETHHAYKMCVVLFFYHMPIPTSIDLLSSGTIYAGYVTMLILFLNFILKKINK